MMAVSFETFRIFSVSHWNVSSLRQKRLIMLRNKDYCYDGSQFRNLQKLFSVALECEFPETETSNYFTK